MAYEETQPGNPHRLTKRQHIIPKALISRFNNGKGQVQLLSKRLGKTLNLDPAADMFVVKRLWDQKAEVVGKKIEDSFLALVDRIILNAEYSFDAQDKRAIEEFYALWRSRHQFYVTPLGDTQLNGVTGEKLDIDVREVLEKKHSAYIQEDGSVPSRFSIGLQITMFIDQFVHRMQNTKWGILRSIGQDFLFPDTFAEFLIIPISPNAVIAAECDSAVVSDRMISQINQHALDSCHDYVFARQLSNCPK